MLLVPFICAVLVLERWTKFWWGHKSHPDSPEGRDFLSDQDIVTAESNQLEVHLSTRTQCGCKRNLSHFHSVPCTAHWDLTRWPSSYWGWTDRMLSFTWHVGLISKKRNGLLDLLMAATARSACAHRVCALEMISFLAMQQNRSFIVFGWACWALFERQAAVFLWMPMLDGLVATLYTVL